MLSLFSSEKISDIFGASMQKAEGHAPEKIDKLPQHWGCMMQGDSTINIAVLECEKVLFSFFWFTNDTRRDSAPHVATS